MAKRTIYLPDELDARLRILKHGAMSEVCQRALTQAVEAAEAEQAAAIAAAFEED